MLLTGLVGSFGSFAIAAFGIGLRINSVAVMPLMGLSSAVVTGVGQNIGAKKIERTKKIGLFATKIAFAITLVFSVALLSAPEFFIRIFSQNPEVIGIGITYLSIVPFSFLLMSINFVLIGVFQGAGKMRLSLFTNIAYWIIVALLGLILSPSMGLAGIWIALVIGTIIEAVFVLWIFYSEKWLDK